MRKRLTQSNQGFTLVELMIAMMLSSVVIGAGFALFINSNRIHHSSTQTSMVQQVARAALEMMSNELLMAGFGTVDPFIVRYDYAGNASQEDEMAFPSGTVNSTTGPDRMQFQVSLGGMSIMAENLSKDQLNDVAVKLLDSQGVDLLKVGDPVVFFNLDRLRMGSGTLGDLDAEDKTFKLSGEVQMGTNDAEVTSFEPGTLIVRRPVFVTYALDGTNLLRCVRNERESGTPCDMANLSEDVDPDTQETTFVLARGLKDLQLSYLLEDAITSASPQGGDFVPIRGGEALPDGWRHRIRAVKIELLVQSKEPDPMVTNCAMAKRKYYIGDRIVNVEESGECELSHVHISTVVHLPNMFTYFSGV